MEKSHDHFICFANSTQKQRQLLRPLNDLKKNPDPSEIERTYNTKKQQTWFYWVCSWERMESATILKLFIQLSQFYAILRGVVYSLDSFEWIFLGSSCSIPKLQFRLISPLDNHKG